MKRLRLSEIEIIKNTPITKDLFDLNGFSTDLKPITENKDAESVLENYLLYLEQLRLSYVETNDRIYLDTLCTMLPNTYKLVNLKQSPDYVKNAVKKWYDKNPDKVKEYQKKYTKTENFKKKQRAYYQANKNKEIARKMEWEKNNPEKVSECKRRYYQKHKQEKNEYSKNYYYKHREEILAKAKERYKGAK